MSEFHCAVIGAGLAGLNVALSLARRGRRVLLVDRKRSLDQGVHTTGIFVRRTFEDFSLPGDCLGPPLRQVSLYSPALRRLDLSSPRSEFRIGRMGPLYLELLRQCREEGVEVALRTQLDSIGGAERENVLHLRTSLADEPSARTATADFVVGADGAVSRVAGFLGLSRSTGWIVGLEQVFRDSPANGPPRMHCLLDPHLAPGYIAWAVHDGEEIHVGVGGAPKRFEVRSALARWTEIVQMRLGLTCGEPIERRGGRIPVGGILPRIASPRGLLVGDAAGAVSPLTAGGLDPCLRLSAFAAEVLEAALGEGSSRPLAAYSGEMFRRKFRSRLWLRAALGSLRSTTLVEGACWALRTEIGRRLAARVFFRPASFPDPPRLATELERLSHSPLGMT